MSSTIKINFKGGIISPGDLYNILVATTKAGIINVSFGLRQQLLIDISEERAILLSKELDKLGFIYEIAADKFPNIVSSYPAEEVFITNTWLSEGVYKDILDAIEYNPILKVNICDSNQSITPMLTGNINWVASTQHQHFWHLFIRFPKTNNIYEWNQMVYTNDVAKLSKFVEDTILNNTALFYDNPNASGEMLFSKINLEELILQPAEKPAELSTFNLPYYEGINKYNNKYWLGIYRRDELFNVSFLKELCQICLDTKIGLLCSTSWKSIIIKGIDEKDRHLWNKLLEKHQINMRHAANELNFQVEDNCKDGLALKNYLVKSLNNDDIRTFGICIGIKTRAKSEVFSSILIRRRPLLKIGQFEAFFVYDILCAKDFNPNERTGKIFSRNNPKIFLAEQLRRAIIAFYTDKNLKTNLAHKKEYHKIEEKKTTTNQTIVHQCTVCFTVYDENFGDIENDIPKGIKFEELPSTYCCNTCEANKSKFEQVVLEQLYSQVI